MEDAGARQINLQPIIVMSRKTVRVEVPSSKPELFIKLGQDIGTKHTALGADSPLDTNKMTTLAARTTSAGTKNTTAKAKDAEAQMLRQQRDTDLGMADGQNAQTPDTVLNLISYARDQLLVTHAGNEEALSEYGFNVVVGTAKGPTKKPPTP